MVDDEVLELLRQKTMHDLIANFEFLRSLLPEADNGPIKESVYFLSKSMEYIGKFCGAMREYHGQKDKNDDTTL